MRRVKSRSVLKRVELILEQERQLAEQAELVRRGHNDPSARPGQANQFAEERPRVLQMLDGFHRRNNVGDTVRQGNPVLVEVSLEELAALWETVILGGINPDVTVEPITNV